MYLLLLPIVATQFRDCRPMDDISEQLRLKVRQRAQIWMRISQRLDEQSGIYDNPLGFESDAAEIVINTGGGAVYVD